MTAYLLRHDLAPEDARAAFTIVDELRDCGFELPALRELATALQSTGATAATMAPRVTALLRAHTTCEAAIAALQQQVADLNAQVDDGQRRRAAICAEIAALDWTPAHVTALRTCDAALAEAEVPAADLVPLLDAARAVATTTGASLATALAVMPRVLAAVTAHVRTTDTTNADHDVATALDVIATAGTAGVPVAQEVDALRRRRARLEQSVADGQVQVAAITAETESLEATAAPLRAAAEAAEDRIAAAATQQQFVESALEWFVHGTAPTPELLRHLQFACGEALRHPGDAHDVGHRYLALHHEQFLEMVSAACQEQAERRAARS